MPLTCANFFYLRMLDKQVLGLLNGLAKRDYYGDSQITNTFLKEQLFPDLSEDDFGLILTEYESILNNMIYSDMDAEQLEAYLTSQLNKKQSSIMEEQKAMITKFWNSNKQKLHRLMVERSTFNNTMKSFKWRVDIDYKDNNAQVSEPKVIFEIGVDTPDGVPQKKIMFESDAETMDKMIEHTEKIEDLIKKITA